MQKAEQVMLIDFKNCILPKNERAYQAWTTPFLTTKVQKRNRKKQ